MMRRQSGEEARRRLRGGRGPGDRRFDSLGERYRRSDPNFRFRVGVLGFVRCIVVEGYLTTTKT